LRRRQRRWQRLQSAAYAKNAKKATKSQRDGLRITDWYHDPIGRMVFDFRLARRLDGGDQMRRNVAIGFVDITGLDDVDTNGYRVVDTDTLKQSNPALYDELGLADRPGIQRFAIVPKANNPSTNDADGAHSEIRLLTEELIYMGVSDTNRVFALYSDRKPCPGCDPRIPKSAKVFYTTPASGGSAARDAIWEAINAAKAAASDERASLKVQVAEQQALDAEQAKDEQVHEQYMSQQTQTLFQNGQNAGPCAGQEETAGQALLASEVTGAQGSMRADPCGGGRPTQTGSAGITTDSGLAKALSQPVPQAPGGIDFSSLQLSYLADPGDGSGLQYSFQASSAAVSSTPADGDGMSDVKSLANGPAVVVRVHGDALQVDPLVTRRRKEELRPMTVVLRRLPAARRHVQPPVARMGGMDPEDPEPGHAVLDRPLHPGDLVDHTTGKSSAKVVE